MDDPVDPEAKARVHALDAMFKDLTLDRTDGTTKGEERIGEFMMDDEDSDRDEERSPAP